MKCVFCHHLLDKKFGAHGRVSYWHNAFTTIEQCQFPTATGICGCRKPTAYKTGEQ